MKVKTSCMVQQFIVVLVAVAMIPFAYPWVFSSKPAIAQQPPSSSSPIAPSGSIRDEAYWNNWMQRLSEIRTRSGGRLLVPPASYGQDWLRLNTELREAQSRGDIPTSHQIGEALLNIEQKLIGTWVIVTVEEQAEAKVEGLVSDVCQSDLGKIYTERHHVFHSKSIQSGWLNYYNNKVIEYNLTSHKSVWEVASFLNNPPPVQPQVSVLESSGFLQSITAGMGRCLLGRVNLDVKPMHGFSLISSYELGKNSIHYASPWITYYPSLNMGYSWKWEQGLNPLSLSPVEIQDLLQKGVLEKTVSWMTAEPATREHLGFSETITLTLNLSLRQQRQPTEIQVATYRIPDFWPEPHYIDMEFRSCRDAENYLDTRKKDEYTAEVVWGELVTEPAQIDGTSLTDGRIQAEVTVNYRIDPPVRSITLPRFNWPNMTRAERDSLQNFYDALMNHEEGHIELAQAFADKKSGRRVSAIGATAEQARANLQTQVEQILKEARRDLRSIEDRYDVVTKNGVNQLAVQEWTDSIEYPNIAVGPNVELSCP